MQPVFLERRAYRLRRLRDAARLLPVLSLGLFYLPLLWHDHTAVGTGLYLFSAWSVLIVLSLILSRLLARDLSQTAPDEEQR